MLKPFYEPGLYVAKVTGQALGKTSTGKPQFVLRFKILGIPDANDPDNYQEIVGYERTMYRAITDKTISWLSDDLEQLGYTGSGFGPLDPSHSQHQSFIGQQIDVYCEHKTDLNGDAKEQWNISHGAPGLKVDPLDSKGVRELDAMFGKSLKKAPATPAKPKPQPVMAISNNLGITDEDVPF